MKPISILKRKNSVGAGGGGSGYTWYLFDVTGNGGDTYVSCGELEMYESSGGTNYAPGTATMTASSNYGAGLVASHLNDGGGLYEYPYMWVNNGTGSGVCWVKAQLSSSKLLGEFKWYCPSGEGVRQPSGIVVSGSNDGSSWTTIKTFTSLTGWVSSALRVFSIP